MAKKNLNKITGGEMSVIFDKLKEDGLIFRCNFSQISKHLLKEFLPVNPFSVDFETLKNEYLKHIEFDKVKVFNIKPAAFNKMIQEKRTKKIQKGIKDENEFHKYICKSYFDLIKEPKEELLELFLKASKHIKDIDDTLSDIKKNIEEITSNKKSKDIQEKVPILKYYKEHNEKAKEEIINFLKNEITEYALNNCYDNSFVSGWLLRVPYRYDWNMKSFKPQFPNDLFNKFGDLQYSEIRDLNNKYKTDKPAFYTFLQNYISENGIIFCISDLTNDNHILNSRKEIILEALSIYENGKKIMFASSVPPIIEGIFHDLCILIGINENDLLQEGFQEKLNRLQHIFGLELHYEYYSFRFRIFRNKVAHGRLTKDDVNELADLLLLDLYDVCKLVRSDKLKLNHKLFVIDELSKNISKPDFKFLMEYLLLNKIEVPIFYKLDKQIEKIEKLISNDDFWEFLEKEIDEGGEPVKHGIYIVLKVISSRKPFDKRCTKLKNKTGINEADTELANNYLKYLTRDF